MSFIFVMGVDDSEGLSVPVRLANFEGHAHFSLEGVGDQSTY